MDQDATWYIVLDGDPAPPTQKGHRSPHFSAHVYCGETVTHLSYCWALVQHATPAHSVGIIRTDSVHQTRRIRCKNRCPPD